jgi:Septum formation
VSRFLAGWGVRILIIAAIAVGAFIFRDRLSGNAGDLAVGDCFDDPGEVAEVGDVQHHPCSESHTGEVIFVGSMTGSNDAYPGEETFFDFVSSNCLPAYESFTGKAYDGEVLDIGFFRPTTKGWADGDRGMICYIYRVDEAPMTGSLKAT